jgi:hypothetical protein
MPRNLTATRRVSHLRVRVKKGKPRPGSRMGHLNAGRSPIRIQLRHKVKR